MRVRSPHEVLEAPSEPAEEPRIRDVVNRPTATKYARVKAQSPSERLRDAFALTAWATNLSREAKRGPDGS